MADHNLYQHLEKLIHFEAAARLLKISAAAAHLRSSPAAISRSIKILESILGRELFSRRQNGIELTEEGRALSNYSKKLIQESRDIEDHLKGIAFSKQSHLRIGTHETLLVYFWPKVLGLLKKKYPSLRISLNSGRVEDLAQGLRNGFFDLIVSVTPFASQGVTTLPLYKTRLGLYAGKSHLYETTFPVLMASTLTLTVLNQVPILTDLKATPRQGLTMRSFLVERGFELNTIFELDSFEAAIRLAQEGLGLAVLPEKTANEALRAGRLRRMSLEGRAYLKGSQHFVTISYLVKNKNNLGIQTMLNEIREKSP